MRENTARDGRFLASSLRGSRPRTNTCLLRIQPATAYPLGLPYDACQLSLGKRYMREGSAPIDGGAGWSSTLGLLVGPCTPSRYVVHPSRIAYSPNHVLSYAVLQWARRHAFAYSFAEAGSTALNLTQILPVRLRRPTKPTP